MGYHLTGILLHALNATTVFLIAQTLAPGEPWRAHFAGLLFALLPVHSENLASINGSLTEGAPTWFYLSAFLCFVLFRRTNLTRYLAMSATAFTASLLSKETAVTLPVMLVCYDFFRTEEDMGRMNYAVDGRHRDAEPVVALRDKGSRAASVLRVLVAAPA